MKIKDNEIQDEFDFYSAKLYLNANDCPICQAEYLDAKCPHIATSALEKYRQLLIGLQEEHEWQRLRYETRIQYLKKQVQASQRLRYENRIQHLKDQVQTSKSLHKYYEKKYHEERTKNESKKSYY